VKTNFNPEKNLDPGVTKMMNTFYHDRIAASLATIETAISKLNYTEAKNAMGALAEVRSLVNTTRDLSKFTDHIWNEHTYVLGPDWENQQSGVNPATGQRYTYVDQWAARYELIRREIVRKLRSGHSIALLSFESTPVDPE
jgi:hypothetical protein